MSDMIPFDYGGTNVRVVTGSDGEPWFMAKDVCDILDLTNVSRAVSGLDDDEKSNITTSNVGGISTENGGRAPVIVNEAGLYSLILRSRKPESKAFKRWVTHEVLPSIRKTGQYAPKQLSGAELMAAALIEAQNTLARRDEQIKELAPKARQFDNFLSSVGDYSVSEAAQALNRAGASTGRTRLHAEMARMGWLYKPTGHKHWRIYQSASDRGLLRLRPMTYRRQDTGEEVATHTVRVTPKGLDRLAKHFGVVISEEEMK